MEYGVVLALNRKADLQKAEEAFGQAGMKNLIRVSNTLELILTGTSRETDILMIDMELPFMDCMSAIGYLVKNRKLKLVLAVADNWEPYWKKESLSGIDIFITRPVEPAKIIPGLKVNIARKEKLLKLEQEYEEEEEAFRKDKILNYTLHLLIDKLKCSETEGMAYLKKYAEAYGKDVYEISGIFYSMLCMEKKSQERKE